MTKHSLSNDNDTQAILLLCSRFSKDSESTPLTLKEFNSLVNCLYKHQYRPADLLKDGAILAELESGGDVQIDFQRIKGLLGRGAALAIAWAHWNTQGLWVLSRSDEAYPQLLKKRLHQFAPPLLYGSGPQDRLDWGWLAIVGSRDANEKALTFTRETAQTCAKNRIQVISGAAKGVDSEAMESALAAGGTVIGILADSLSKAVVAKKHREGLRSGQLTLITPYDPAASFSVGNAMGRNKLIYVLSNAALVICSSAERGGTWEGAKENLRKKWVPLYVRNTDFPLGNQLLIQDGGLPHELPQPPASLIDFNGSSKIDTPQPEEQPTTQEEATIQDIALQTAEYVEVPQEQTAEDASPRQPQTAFDILWPHLEKSLQKGTTAKDLAQSFNVQVKQMEIWLGEAITNGQVEKLAKPVRYILKQQLALL
jgi:predicted Rossmann fold nucleotide-binding protein DprA/Smf involved in DNA uptake